MPYYLKPGLRQFALLTHIACSVGWFGAIIPYIALTVAGLVSQDPQTARAAYLAMELIGWFVIVPLGVAALLSGLVQSLGTQWGLLRHWWIVVKLALTLFAVIILLRHMQDVSRVAQMARGVMLSSVNFRPELVHSTGGLLVVFAAMTLSVLKPWGMTPYGQRHTEMPSAPREARHQRVLAASRPRWGRIILYHALALALLFMILHVTGLQHH
jgi:hypothetical protein